jgi:hypothetical protein
MRWIICLTLLLLLAPVQAATTGTVTGSVVNADGKAMIGQKVRFKRVLSRPPIGKISLAADSLAVATVTTDKEGKFTQDLEPGEYWAEAGNKTNGYAKERFTIKTGEKIEIKLTLTKDETPK